MRKPKRYNTGQMSWDKDHTTLVANLATAGACAVVLGILLSAILWMP